MPEMTLLGWFHTVLGVIALVSAFYTLYHHKIISLNQISGRIYILVTLIVAGSALGIYNQGGFGIADTGGSLWWYVDGEIAALWQVFEILSNARLFEHSAFSHDSSNHRLSAKITRRRSFC